MNRSFDKILVRRIREVFDNHTETMDAYAWGRMEEKLNAGGNLRVIYVQRITRIAAVLLLLLLVFWPFNQGIRDYPGISENQVISQQQLPVASQNNENLTDSESKGIDSNQKEVEKADKLQQETALTARDEQDTGEQSKGPTEKIAARQKGVFSVEEPGLQKEQTLRQGIRIDQTQYVSVLNISESKSQTFSWDKVSAINAEKSRERKVNLGVAFSTLYNYSPKATESDLNFSGGVMSAFKLLPNLSMHTGMILSRQYFTTHNGKNVPFDLLSTAKESYSSASLISNSNRVELVGLDIPVNLQYRYKDLSFAAGISSITYIQEQHSYNYSTEYVYTDADRFNADDSEAETTIIRSESVEQSYDPLRQIDLANILNLSVGYHFTFNRSQLVVEPYIKHPLGDLTSQDIRFGSRGIRLKFQF